MTTHASITSPLVPKIATPFGGGIARSGSVCGCGTGVLMYIGSRLGRTKTADDREKAYEAATTFFEVFKRKFGSLICYELIGCDFRTPEGKACWKQMVEILLNPEKRDAKERVEKGAKRSRHRNPNQQ